MMFVPSDRDRLLLTFAEAERYGIAARDAFAPDEESGRHLLREAVRRAAPHGLGSYVFWTWADCACFDAQGHLVSDLTLYTSGEESARAVRAILAVYGFDTIRDDGANLVLPPRGGLPERSQTPLDRPAG
jgi:hypothetical protein